MVGASYCCGRLSVGRKRPSKVVVSITPEELGQTMKRGSLPMHWLGDLDGQKRYERFPMVGTGKGKGWTIRYMWQRSM